MLRNPTVTAFHPQPTPGDNGSFVESPATCMLSDHARNHGHYMAAQPVDADPPSKLHFPCAKPKPIAFSRKPWHKDAAKRKLFLLDHWQSGKETLPIYSLPSRSGWERDGDGPASTVPSSYAAHGLVSLPVTRTHMFVAHTGPVLEVAKEFPVNTERTRLSTPPGTWFVVVNGRLGIFGVGTKENSNVVRYWLDMPPTKPELADRSWNRHFGALARRYSPLA